MPRPAHLEAGDDAEGAALAYLEKCGLRCRVRNYRCRFGEIDLIMQDGRVIVFVEVRYRRSRSMPDAVESIGPAKRRRLFLAACQYLGRYGLLDVCPTRFDVVAIDGLAAPADALQWLKDAFRPGD